MSLKKELEQYDHTYPPGGNNPSLKSYLSAFEPNANQLSQNQDVMDGYSMDQNDDYFQGTTSNKDYIPEGMTELSGIDFEEYRATMQGTLDKAGKGLARLGFKTAMNVLEMPGIAYGAVKAAVTGDPYALIDNGWSNAIKSANEWFDEEAMPVYMKKSVKEGSLWDNIKSVDFWATEGADGLAFALAAIAPGAALKGFKTGAKAAHLIGKAKGGKYLQKMDDAINTLTKGDAAIGAGSATASTIDVAGATAFNTLYEAGMEAQMGMDSYNDKLVGMLQNGELSNEQFTELIGQTGQVGSNIFKANAALLLLPNAIMSKSLFGRALPKKQLNKFDRVDGKFTDALANKTSKQKVLDGLKATGKTVGTNLASEGFLEEAGQMTAEHYFQDTPINKELGKENKSVLETYMDVVGSTEGQKAIMLGGVIGSGMTAFSSVKNRKANAERREQLANMMTSGANLMDASIDGLYEKDEEGNIKLDNKNKPIIDQAKLDNFAKETEFTQNLLEKKEKLDEAVTNNEISESSAKVQKKMIDDVLRKSALMSFVRAGEEGMEALENYLDNSGLESVVTQANEGISKEKLAQKVNKEKSDLMTEAKEMQKDIVYAETYLQYKNELASEKNNDYYSPYMEKLQQAYTSATTNARELVATLEPLKAEIEKVHQKNPTMPGEKNIIMDNLLEELNILEQVKKDLDNNIKEMLDPKKQKKAFDAFVKEQKALENVNEEAKEIDSEIESLKKPTLPQDEFDKIIEKYELEPELWTEDVKNLKNQVDALNDPDNKSSLEDYDTALNSIDKFQKDLVANGFEEIDELVSLKAQVTAKKTVQKALMENFKEQLSDILRQLKDKSLDAAVMMEELEEEITKQDNLRKTLAKDMSAAAENKGAKRGRNAKLWKSFIAEQNAHLDFVTNLVTQLKTQRDVLKADLKNLDTQIINLQEKYDLIDKESFLSLDDIVDYLKENRSKITDVKHRFDLPRLITEQVYTEIQIEELTESIDILEQYAASLKQALSDYSAPVKEEVEFYTRDLKKVQKQLAPLEKELRELNAKHQRLTDVIVPKEMIDKLTKEINFIENLEFKAEEAAPKPAQKEYIPPVQEIVEKKRKQKAEKVAKINEEAAEKVEEENETASSYNEIIQAIHEDFEVGDVLKMPEELETELPPDTPVTLISKKEDGTLEFEDVGGFVVAVTPKGIVPVIEEVVPLVTEGVDLITGNEINISTEVNTEIPEIGEETDPKLASEGLGVSESFLDYFQLNGQDKKGMKVSLSIFNPGTINKEDATRKLRDNKGNNLNFTVKQLKENSKAAVAVYNKIIKNEPISPAQEEVFVGFFPLNVDIDGTNHSTFVHAEFTGNPAKPERKIRKKIFDILVAQNKKGNPLRIADISTTIKNQGKGKLNIDPTPEAKNNLNDLLNIAEVGIETIDFNILNDVGVLVNPDTKKPVPGSTIYNRKWKGAIFATIKRDSTGEDFPLHVNISKINEEHADALYELSMQMLSNPAVTNNTKLNTLDNYDILKDAFKLEIEMLEKLDGLLEKEVTIDHLVRFMFFTGSKTAKSKLQLNKDSLVFGDTTISSLADVNENTKESFINWVIYNKNRNIVAKYLTNPEYKRYIADSKVLYSNAKTGEVLFKQNTEIFLDLNLDFKEAEVNPTQQPTQQTNSEVTRAKNNESEVKGSFKGITYGNSSKSTGESEDSININADGSIIAISDGMGGESFGAFGSALLSEAITRKAIKSGKIENITFDDLLEVANGAQKTAVEIFKAVLHNKKVGVGLQEALDDVALLLKGVKAYFVTNNINQFVVDLYTKPGEGSGRLGATTILTKKTGENSYNISKIGDTVYAVVDANNNVIESHGFSENSQTNGVIFGINTKGDPKTIIQKSDNFKVTLKKGQRLLLATDFIETNEALDDFLKSYQSPNFNLRDFIKEHKFDDATYSVIEYNDQQTQQSGTVTKNNDDSTRNSDDNVISLQDIDETRNDLVEKEVVKDTTKELEDELDFDDLFGEIDSISDDITPIDDTTTPTYVPTNEIEEVCDGSDGAGIGGIDTSLKADGNASQSIGRTFGKK